MESLLNLDRLAFPDLFVFGGLFVSVLLLLTLLLARGLWSFFVLLVRFFRPPVRQTVPLFAHGADVAHWRAKCAALQSALEVGHYEKDLMIAQQRIEIFKLHSDIDRLVEAYSSSLDKDDPKV